MLVLGQHDYQYGQLLAYDYKRIDGNIHGGSTASGVGYIRNKYVENVLLPVAFNNIGFKHATYNINDNYSIQDAVEDIEEFYTNANDTTFGYLKIYSYTPDETAEALTSDLFQTPSSVIQDLYNKCMEQVTAREELHNPAKTIIKTMRGKHIVVLVSNYDDYNQASDFFLTAGLIPIIFSDWKEKFTDVELEYFKVLVNRSQVKRISNVKANEAYDTLTNQSKYANKIREMRTQAAIQNIVNNRIRQAQNTVSNAEEAANRYLNNYATEKRKYYDALKILNQLESDQDSFMEEVKLATTMEGIDNIDTPQPDMLRIGFKGDLTFFDTEEAEIIINRMDDDWVKRLFTDVFIEQKYKLKVYSEFYFSFSPQNGLRQGSELSAQYLNSHDSFYNPHIQYFNCLGDYKPQLIDAQAKQDLLMFNNLALASTKSLNFRDGAVLGRLQTTLRGYNTGDYYDGTTFLNIKCLEDSEGKLHSMNELYLSNPEPTELEVEDL